MLHWAHHAVWGDAFWAPLASFGMTLLLVFLSHWSLVLFTGDKQATAGRLTRLSLLPITLYFAADFVFNRSYTFGSVVRDACFPAFGWHLLAKAFDVGIVFDIELQEGKPLPRWCIPDWEKEEQDRHILVGEKPMLDRGASKRHRDGNGTGLKGKATTQLRWWQRSIKIPRRPTWAVDGMIIPRHWKIVSLPVHAADQLLWTVDVMFLRRPGTSALFPNEMRALDWSMKKLQTAGEAQHQRALAGEPHATPLTLTKSLHPFGYVELSPIFALCDFALVVWAYRYFNGVDLARDSFSNFFANVPLHQQCALTLCIGTFIAIAQGPVDFVVLPLMLRWPLRVPETAITPEYRDVARSQSLAEMWGWRWHTRSQRDFIRLGRLIPIGAPNDRVAAMLKAFFWSGVFHSLLFVRTGAPLSWRAPFQTIIAPIFLRPGTMAFFLMHGVLILVETAVDPLLQRTVRRFVGRDSKINATYDATEPSTATAAAEAAAKYSIRHWRMYLVWVARLVWVWGVLTWTGRWLVAELYAAGWLDRSAIATMHLSRQYDDYTTYILHRLGVRRGH